MNPLLRCLSALPAALAAALVAIAVVATVAALPARATPAPLLSLDQAVERALDHAPLLDAADARIDAASATRIAAGRLPDPELSLAAQNLPIEGDDAFRFSAERMTQRRVGLMQRFPSGARRAAERDAADSRIRVAEADYRLRRQQLRLVTAQAWIDWWAAARQLALLRELEPPYAALVSAAEARVAGGGAVSAALRARLALTHLQQRQRDADVNVDAARARLAQWSGDIGNVRPDDLPELPAPDPVQLRRELPQRTELAPLRAQQTLDDSDLRLADAARRPDWSLGLAYGDRDPAFGDLLSLEVRVGLPLFTGSRQDALIAAARERQRATDAELAQRYRELDATLEAALARWRGADERWRHFQHEHLPLADAAVDAALAAYRGSGSLGDVLDARRDALEQRLAALDAERERALAWAALAYLDDNNHAREDSASVSGVQP